MDCRRRRGVLSCRFHSSCFCLLLLCYVGRTSNEDMLSRFLQAYGSAIGVSGVARPGGEKYRSKARMIFLQTAKPGRAALHARPQSRTFAVKNRRNISFNPNRSLDRQSYIYVYPSALHPSSALLPSSCFPLFLDVARYIKNADRRRPAFPFFGHFIASSALPVPPENVFSHFRREFCGHPQELLLA